MSLKNAPIFFFFYFNKLCHFNRCTKLSYFEKSKELSAWRLFDLSGCLLPAFEFSKKKIIRGREKKKKTPPFDRVLNFAFVTFELIIVDFIDESVCHLLKLFVVSFAIIKY